MDLWLMQYDGRGMESSLFLRVSIRFQVAREKTVYLSFTILRLKTKERMIVLRIVTIRQTYLQLRQMLQSQVSCNLIIHQSTLLHATEAIAIKANSLVVAALLCSYSLKTL